MNTTMDSGLEKELIEVIELDRNYQKLHQQQDFYVYISQLLQRNDRISRDVAIELIGIWKSNLQRRYKYLSNIELIEPFDELRNQRISLYAYEILQQLSAISNENHTRPNYTKVNKSVSYAKDNTKSVDEDRKFSTSTQSMVEESLPKYEGKLRHKRTSKTKKLSKRATVVRDYQDIIISSMYIYKFVIALIACVVVILNLVYGVGLETTNIELPNFYRVLSLMSPFILILAIMLIYLEYNKIASNLRKQSVHK